MAADVGIKIQLDGEKEYKQSLKEIISQQKEWDSEIRAVESSLDSETSAQEKARKKHELLTKSIGEQERKIELMKDQLKKAEQTYGTNSEQAKKLRTNINNATTALNKMKAAAKQAAEKMGSVGKSMQEAGKKMQKAGDVLSKSVSAPLLGVAAGAIAAWNDLDDAMDNVARATGATGEELQALQGIARDIATTIPTDFDTAAAAVGEVNTKFGLTGEALEDLSTTFVKFSDITGQDVTSAVDGVQKALAAFNLDADDAPALLDAIAKASQKTGIKVDALEASLVKNAASLSAMGLSAEDATVFLSQLEMSGANTETVMTGMQKAMTNAAKDGKTLPQALSEFQSVMNSTATDTEKLNAAVNLFGAKAGPAIYEACKNGSIDFGKLGEAAEDAAGTVNTTFDSIRGPADRYKVALNNVKEAGAKLGGSILERVAPALETLSGAVSTAGDWFDSLDGSQQNFVLGAGGFLIGIGPFLKGFGMITEGAGKAVTKVSELISGAEGLGGLGGVGGPIALAVAGIAGASILFGQAKEEVIEGNGALSEILELTTAATEELNGATKSLETALSDAQSNIDEVDAKAATAQGLIDELEELSNQGYQTTASIRRMKTICEELNTIYPGLNASVDENTGALSKGTDEMRAYVEQARKMQLVEAYNQATKDVMLKLVEAQAALTQAQRDAGPALEDYNRLVAEQQAAQDAANAAIESGAGAFDTTQAALDEANYALGIATEAYAPYKEAVEAAQAAVDEANGTLDIYAEAQDALTAELGESETAAQGAEDAFTDLGETQEEAGETAEQAAETIKKSYQEIYDAAYDKIAGAAGAFDKLEVDSETSTASMIENLNSQLSAYSNYSTNLDTVLSYLSTSTDENATAVAQALIDMGMDGADEVAALAQAIADGSADVDTILQTFGQIESNKELAAQLIAEFQGELQGGFEDTAEDIEDAGEDAEDAVEDYTTGIEKAATKGAKGVKSAVMQYGKAFELPTSKIKNEGKPAKKAARDYGTGIETAINRKTPTVKTASDNLGKAATKAKETIDAGKPAAQTAAEQYGDSVATGLNNKKQAVTTAAGNMVSGASTAINQKKADFVAAGKTLGSGVVEGINDKKEAIANAAAGGAGAASTKKAAYTTAGDTLGKAAGDGVVSGFNSKKTAIGNAVSGGASKVSDYYETYKKSGGYLGDGIIAGLNSKSGSINWTAQQLAQNAADTINKALKIGSPSKVTMESGEWTAIGFAEGMKKMLPSVTRVAGRLAAAAVPEAATGTGIAAARSGGADAIYQAVKQAVTEAAPQLTITEKSFKRGLAGMGVVFT